MCHISSFILDTAVPKSIAANSEMLLYSEGLFPFIMYQYIICSVTSRFLVIQIKDNLAGLAGKHNVKSFLKIFEVELMCNDRCNLLVQAGNKHVAHLVPRLVHLTAVDTFQ